MEKENYYNLEFLRIYDINLVPRYLFEQLEHREWDVDRVYKASTLINSNPCTMLWALMNDNHEIKGVLWCNLNYLTDVIDCYVLSIDKEYQGQGKYILKTVELLKPFKKKIKCITAMPEIFEKLGYKRTKYIYMEV